MSIPRAKRGRTPEERLGALESRYRHEIMSVEERCELADRIHKLRKVVGA